MEYKTLRYPGDPDQTIRIMTGEEFVRVIREGKPAYLKVGPMMPGTIDLDESQAATYPVDGVVCDLCGQQIADEDFLALDRSSAICKECFDKSWAKWVLP